MATEIHPKHSQEDYYKQRIEAMELEIEQLRLEIMQKDKTIEDLILLTEVKN